MSWNEIGVLAEVLGAMAVVISLIYLSQQVRQHTLTVRATNATTVQGNFQQLARLFYTDREAAEIILRAMSSESNLTPTEKLSAGAYFFDFYKTAELAHYQYLRGELDHPLWEGSLNFYKAYFSTPGFRAYWKNRQSAFSPEFREAVEEWVAVPGPLARPDEYVKSEW